MRHLYSNQCHDESEVWCEDPDYYGDGEPTNDPAKADCAKCLRAAAKFGADAEESLRRVQPEVTHWKPCGKDDTGTEYTLFKLDEQDADHRIDLGHNAWLLVKVTDDIHVDFACFDFLSSNIDGSDAVYHMLFRGHGPSSSLRECRHIWWGDLDDGGYTYFLNFAAVEAAFRELRTWFDGS